MELTFTQTDIPEQAVTRTAAPNPFDGKFPSDDKALVLAGLPFDTDADAKAVKTLERQARQAGTAVDRTTRIKREIVKVPARGRGTAHETVTLTLWTVPAIKRPRKNGAA